MPLLEARDRSTASLGQELTSSIATSCLVAATLLPVSFSSAELLPAGTGLLLTPSPALTVAPAVETPSPAGTLAPAVETSLPPTLTPFAAEAPTFQPMEPTAAVVPATTSPIGTLAPAVETSPPPTLAPAVETSPPPTLAHAVETWPPPTLAPAVETWPPPTLTPFEAEAPTFQTMEPTVVVAPATPSPTAIFAPATPSPAATLAPAVETSPPSSTLAPFATAPPTTGAPAVQTPVPSAIQGLMPTSAPLRILMTQHPSQRPEHPPEMTQQPTSEGDGAKNMTPLILSVGLSTTLVACLLMARLVYQWRGRAMRIGRKAEVPDSQGLNHTTSYEQRDIEHSLSNDDGGRSDEHRTKPLDLLNSLHVGQDVAGSPNSRVHVSSFDISAEVRIASAIGQTTEHSPKDDIQTSDDDICLPPGHGNMTAMALKYEKQSDRWRATDEREEIGESGSSKPSMNTTRTRRPFVGSDEETLPLGAPGDGVRSDASVSSGDDSKSSGRRGKSKIAVSGAVMQAAQELAQSSMIPGVVEATTLVSILLQFVLDHEENARAAEWRVRWCRSILAILERAAGVLGKDDKLIDEPDRVLVDDVRESIDDLVQIIQTYNSKNKISKVMVSSLFKRRQEEAEMVINMAVMRLQVTLDIKRIDTRKRAAGGH